MAFLRYVTVFYNAGKTIRCRFEVKHEKSLIRTATLFRLYSTQGNVHVDKSPITEEVAVESVILSEKQHFASQPVAFVDASDTNGITDSDSFGKNYFTGKDLVEDCLDNNVELPKALDPCTEDMSYISPYHVPTFNFAAYANNSPIIQELAKLGVDLHRIESRPKAMQLLLQRTLDDLKPHIQFLHDSGVLPEDIGKFITKNPLIFQEEIDDLHTRIRYLRAHEFDREMVARIVTKDPYWLMFNTTRIDRRLGYFQQEFGLNGSNVRYLACKQPRLITYSTQHIKENTFAIKEEMGFDKYEVKSILLAQPRLFMKSRKHIVDVFDFVHNTMKLPHQIISRQCKILTCRLERLRTRHKFLEMVGKAQYDPTKPMYVSAEALIGGSDVDFCKNVAKTTVQTYNLYLKNL